MEEMIESMYTMGEFRQGHMSTPLTAKDMVKRPTDLLTHCVELFRIGDAFEVPALCGCALLKYEANLNLLVESSDTSAFFDSLTRTILRISELGLISNNGLCEATAKFLIRNYSLCFSNQVLKDLLLGEASDLGLQLLLHLEPQPVDPASVRKCHCCDQDADGRGSTSSLGVIQRCHLCQSHKLGERCFLRAVDPSPVSPAFTPAYRPTAPRYQPTVPSYQSIPSPSFQPTPMPTLRSRGGS